MYTSSYKKAVVSKTVCKTGHHCNTAEGYELDRLPQAVHQFRRVPTAQNKENKFEKKRLKSLKKSFFQLEKTECRLLLWSTEDQSSNDMGTHETFMVPKAECGSDMGPHR